MESQYIKELIADLKKIPDCIVELKEGQSGLRFTRPFFGEKVYPITVNYNGERQTVTILISNDFNDFVGISTYGQPTLEMVNSVMNVVNNYLKQ